jgi:hypothetical protein
MNGFIIYEGPSEIDGAPIVVILTGLKPSKNRKTGAMLQTWILRADVHPVEAVRSGDDESICGNCQHRPTLAAKLDKPPCYVDTGRAPAAIWNAYRRGSYARVDPEVAAILIAGRRVRIGSYGDPAAARPGLWRALIQFAEGHTGYSHQWQRPGFDFDAWRGLVMASADTLDEAALANLHGMRVFRVTVGPDKQQGEVTCPASKEAGARAQCADCLLCGGTSKAARDIVIQDHARGHQRRVIQIAKG